MAIRGRIRVTAALLGLALLTPLQASAALLVPFQATVYEHYTVSVCAPDTRCITATGSGEATQLGQVTQTSTVRVDLNPAHAVNGCVPETRETVLVASNGDELTMSAGGWGCPASSSAQDQYTVTGGTGRFQGATGSGMDVNVHTLSSASGGVAVTTYSGTLSSPGSLKPAR
ncbi:MAG TPA: hypothetical protein VFU72_14315 [Nitrolancea sp.]|nr:hypothetical protein [Nitrolancea sp.]